MKTNKRLILSIFLTTFSLTPAAFSKLNPNTSQIGKESVSLAVTKVVLKDGQGTALCQSNVTGLKEAVPSFMQVAPAGHESSIEVDLRTCDDSELSIVAAIAKNTQFQPKVAAAPAVIGIGLAACAIGGVAGIVFETADTVLVEGVQPSYPYKVAVYGTPASIMASNALKGASMGKKVVAGTGAGLVSIVCSELAELGTSFGLDFLME